MTGQTLQSRGVPRRVFGRLATACLVAIAVAGVVGWPASGQQTWQTGDVFVGVQNRTYRVWRPIGTGNVSELAPVRIPDVPDGSGMTAGCAVDWVTGRLYTTDFESIVTEIDPNGKLLRRLSTPRLPAETDPQMSPGNWISWAPESIVFSGDLTTRRFYVGHVEGLFESSPFISGVQQLYESVPIAEDGVPRGRLWPQALPNPQLPEYPDGTLRSAIVTRMRTAEPVPGEPGWYFVLDYSTPTAPRFVSTDVSVPGDNYAPVRIDSGGFWEAPKAGGMGYTRIVDVTGNVVPARPMWGKDLHAYDAAVDDWAGTARYFETAYGAQGTDWIDLASDQRTIFYTSEANVIYRYDVGSRRQLVPFAVLPSSDRLFGLRLLPPGDGSGGLLVAAGIEVYRLDARGRVVQRYDADEDAFFSINLSPDAKTFWAASQRPGGGDRVYQFDIATGQLLRRIDAQGSVGGLCVMLEYTAAREPCDGVDNDHDGTVDNNCPPTAADDAYVATADRALSVPAATGVLANDSDPDGDSLTAVLVQGPMHGTLVLRSDGSFTYTPRAGFTGTETFTYQADEGVSKSRVATVTITVVSGTNQPPVCSAARAEPSTIWPPDHRVVPVRIGGVSDPDGHSLTLQVTSIRQDEPVDTEADGRHVPDGRIVPNAGGGSHAEVRAERAGTPKRPGDGRVYHIGFTADDGQGGSCAGEVTVCVPHDQGRRPVCVDGGPVYDSTAAPGGRGVAGRTGTGRN